MRNGPGQLAAWVLRRPGYLLLTASDGRLASEPAERFRHGWLEVMGWSLIWGLAMANLWGVAWRVFHDYEPLIMPAVMTGTLLCLWPYRRAVTALVDFVGGPSASGRGVAGAVVVGALLLSLARLLPEWERGPVDFSGWRGFFSWLWPQAKLYRVLLLMPLWGGWAMLIATRFCPCRESAEPQVAAFAGGCRPLPAAISMTVPLAPTLVYFGHLGQGSLVVVALAALAAAILAGPVFCRAAGGLRRSALLAANLATQIVFLWAYLAARSARWIPG